ncbi:MAG: outer membrane lipoprotein-sorting protein, partial [Chloroflexi bacterium]|nr:outer membrane lipoprotein-sorting protein [Chloroflexota bacterium]
FWPDQSGAAQPSKPKTGYTNTTGEGLALARELISQRPAENLELYGVLKMRDGAGKRREVPVRYSIKAGEPNWQGIYETVGTPQLPAEKLVVSHTPGQPNLYLLARANRPGGTLPEPAAVTAANAATAFAGSDFWLTDLGLEFLHWPEQRVVKKQMRKGRQCQVVESVNPLTAAGDYRRVLSWIDNETGGLVRAEAYGHDDQLLKEFSLRHFTRVEGRWQLKEMEIRNEKTDSRTRLEFDLELK